MKRRRPVLELHTNSTYSRDDSNSSSVTSSLLGLESKTLVDYGHAEDRTVAGKDAINSAMAWQVCVDETTGYTYYWNMVTNQVTWDMPAEYAAYENMAQQYDTTGFNDESKTNQLSKISEDYQNASMDSVSKKLNCRNGKSDLFPAYGPLAEDEINLEENEAKKMACARKRLMSYKTEKLKSKSDEPVKEISAVDSHNSVVTPHTPDGKILFVPTPDEVKEHPIFSYSSALQASYNPVKVENKFPEHSQTKSTSNQPNDGNNKLRLIADNYSDSDDGDQDEDDEGDDDLDDVIIARLREKALLLKNLGGEVPKEMMSILDESKSASDIIEELEREMRPPSHERSTVVQSASIKINSDTKRSQLSAVKSSDNNSRLSDLMNDARNLFAGRAGRKTSQTKVQKIKLSARAKELIKTSLLTAKARATNFVETEDGLKPAEEVARIKEEKAATIKNEEMLTTASEPEQRPNLGELDKFQKEISQLSSTVKNEVANLPPLNNTVMENNESNSSTPRAIEDDRFNFQKSFVVLNPKRPKVLDDIEKRPANVDSSSLGKYVSLVNKCEEFLESVKKTANADDAVSNPAKSPPTSPLTTRSSVSPPPSDDFSKAARTATSHSKTTVEDMDIDIDEVLNTKTEYSDKSITDLSQLIMEKLKFLSNNKDDVAPVQVMAIQIETLVGAWQNGSLSAQYLSDWLDASVVHLRSIEDSASPPGWSCEWDRSYGRYYYRNLDSGAIQWDFPEPAERSRSSSPSPNFDEMVPPPPPIISCDRESRKRKPSPPSRRPNSDGYKNSRTATRDPSPPPPPPPTLTTKLTLRPPLPPSLSVIPPPLPSVPPPSSPPPPPLPPSPTPIVEQHPVKEPNTSSSRIHEALDSFYSDLATIEESLTNKDDASQMTLPLPPSQKEERSESFSSSSQRGNVEEKMVKKKKKTVKLDSSLSLKKKGLQGLVAKWQNVHSSM